MWYGAGMLPRLRELSDDERIQVMKEADEHDNSQPHGMPSRFKSCQSFQSRGTIMSEPIYTLYDDCFTSGVILTAEEMLSYLCGLQARGEFPLFLMIEGCHESTS